mmetsp:Transcript_117362/g.373998  ORF Transcript_117362/g.373998 Transcript_117362/m.373998 type:complete len:717 (+) Transcript_117362:95-2245(+)
MQGVPRRLLFARDAVFRAQFQFRGCSPIAADRCAVAASESSPRFTFVVRARRGLEGLLHRELSGLRGLGPRARDAAGGDGDDALSVCGAEGTVEFTAPWHDLYPVVFQSRLAESVWVRVGDSFSCSDALMLSEAVRAAPWDSFLDAPSLAGIPLSVRSRECRLDRNDIFAALDQTLQSLAGKSSRTLRDQWSPYRLGLRAVVTEDMCSLELNCTGRLGVRPFVYESPPGGGEGAESALKPIPTPYRGDALSEGSKSGKSRGLPSWSLRPGARAEPELQRQEDPRASVVSQEWHGTRDLHSTHAAALVSHLPLQRLLDDDPRGGILLWDPFCGSGALLLEVLSVVLGVMPMRSAQGLAVGALRPHQGLEAIPGLGPTARPIVGIERLSLLGSDMSATAILRARRLLHRFCTYHRDEIPAQAPGRRRRSAAEKEEEASRQKARSVSLLRGPSMLEDDDAGDGHDVTAVSPWPSARRPGRRQQQRQATPTPAEGEVVEDAPRERRLASSVAASSTSAGSSSGSTAPRPVTREALQSFSSSVDAEWGIQLPCELSLNIARFERIAQFVSGALVVTRVPSEVHTLGPTARSAALHRQFGHFLASRPDLLGAYVLTESKVFRRQSRLDWEVLQTFVDHSGQKWRLLRWTKARPHGHSTAPGGVKAKAVPVDAAIQPKRPKRMKWQRKPSRLALGRPRRIARPPLVRESTAVSAIGWERGGAS